jgi:hypothetical protein
MVEAPHSPVRRMVILVRLSIPDSLHNITLDSLRNINIIILITIMVLQQQQQLTTLPWQPHTPMYSNINTNNNTRQLDL